MLSEWRFEKLWEKLFASFPDVKQLLEQATEQPIEQAKIYFPGKGVLAAT